MASKFKLFTAISSTAFAVSLVLYFIWSLRFLKSISITLGVFAYHFTMRLLVGLIINTIFKNDMKYTRKWFQPRKFEAKLYAFLRVKTWKAHIPTYAPDTFSMADLPLESVIKATCQAEIVHEVIIALSFLPVLLTIPFGDAWVFVITSVLAALLDSVFVILQRFNRPRLIKLMARANRKAKSA